VFVVQRVGGSGTDHELHSCGSTPPELRYVAGAPSCATLPLKGRECSSRCVWGERRAGVWEFAEGSGARPMAPLIRPSGTFSHGGEKAMGPRILFS
jgi:hypothetical protein